MIETLIQEIRADRPVDLYANHKTGLTEKQFREVCGHQNIWHSIDLGDLFIEGARKNLEVTHRESKLVNWPDLRDKTVLDIGAFGGWFSFEAERRGAKSVTAIDYYSWAVNWPEYMDWIRKERAAGRVPDPYRPPPQFINVDESPGRLVFDTTKKVLNSQVATHTVLAEEFESDPFDLVLYLGVLYHTENPFHSMQKIANLTKDHLIVETLGIHIPGHEDFPLWQYIHDDSTNNDPTTWWAPNEKGLEMMCRACGFNKIEITGGISQLSDVHKQARTPYRIWMHAWK